MKIKIVDTFPTAKIYINDNEIDGVVKYKINRSMGNLPVVSFKMIPRFMEIDLSKSININPVTRIIFLIRKRVKQFLNKGK